MKKAILGVAALTLAVIAAPSFADEEMTCRLQPAPTVPATFESEEHAVEVRNTIVDYQTGAMKDYRECLAAKERMLGEDISPEQKKALVDAYNASVDLEEELAASFSAAAKAYNEAHPD
ncbi:MAG: hypothetical protein EP340_08925 [Alphaproteobacteria bacterium]|nr:MAG: hypothetical protein EP340_08925 [Alphaproteobacteria bacterium]